MNIKALGTALKNKVTDKVGGAMATPYIKYQEAKQKQADNRYQIAKDYNTKRKAGVPVSGKEQAQFQMVKDHYSK